MRKRRVEPFVISRDVAVPRETFHVTRSFHYFFLQTMDQLQSQVKKLFEGRIDFEGQRFVEKLIHYSLSSFVAIAFVVGFVRQSLFDTFTIFGSLTLCLALVVVPPWPYLNRHSVTWLAPVQDSKKTS